MTDHSDLRGTAYHEAGHAVVAWSLNLGIHSVTIRADNVRAGETKIVDSVQHPPLEDQLAIVVAGREAGNIFNAPVHESTYQGDTKQMIELLADMPDHQSSALINQAHERVHQLLMEHKTKVELLAARLMDTRHVGAAEFARLMS
jgi:ATP-dependent Zn protease